MALLYKCDFADPEQWRQRLASYVSDLDMRIWPDVGDPADIDMALVWEPAPGDLRRYPNLKAIFSTSAGVDHIFVDRNLPNVPICRIVDPYTAVQLSEYSLYYILRFHRRFFEADAHRARNVWEKPTPFETSERTIGILGLGNLGGDIARKVAALGFPVMGWSRTQKAIPGVSCFCGDAGLQEVLNRSHILVSVLPSTPETFGLLDGAKLRQLPRGAFLINAGRGVHIIEQDLLAVLDEGHIERAALDVFAVEPLPAAHPFWAHPSVEITPHMAATANPRTAAAQIGENIRRLLAGEPLLNVVDPERSY